MFYLASFIPILVLCSQPATIKEHLTDRVIFFVTQPSPPFYCALRSFLSLNSIISYVFSFTIPIFLCIMFFIYPHPSSFCNKLYFLSFCPKHCFPLSVILRYTNNSPTHLLFIPLYLPFALIIHYILFSVHLIFPF